MIYLYLENEQKKKSFLMKGIIWTKNHMCSFHFEKKFFIDLEIRLPLLLC